MGRNTFAAILRHIIIARLVELDIILNANPDFNTGILTSLLVCALELSDGRFRETTDSGCVQVLTLHEKNLQQEILQQGGTLTG